MNTAGKIVTSIILAAGIGLMSWGIYEYLKPLPPDDKNPNPNPNPNTTTTTPTTPPATQVITSGFSMGENLYAYRLAKDASHPVNIYTAPAASVNNVYKSYPAYSFIGTYLGKEGVYIKLILKQPGFFGSNEVVYALEGDVYAKR